MISNHEELWPYLLWSNNYFIPRFLFHSRTSSLNSRIGLTLPFSIDRIEASARGFGKYQLIEGQETSLMCDGGSENKGMVNDYLQELEIEKIVAQKDIRFSNSMVEAVNKRIKYDFLYRRSFDSLQTLQDYLPCSF